MCDQDTDSLNPDLMYSRNAMSQNPTYHTDMEYPQNVGNPNQIYEPDVCSEPAHGPANSDGTPSIEPLTATYQEGDDDNDNDKPTTSTTSGAVAENEEIDDITRDAAVEVNAVPSVRPKSTSRPSYNDLHIKPYAVRYQTDIRKMMRMKYPKKLMVQMATEEHTILPLMTSISHHTLSPICASMT
ncbi:Hypp3748 [Branchiostoma lanceolatum]|uniref:Hypp3748 protein n=1 Tax=Branchiostoma lanceolatum TaxID=7740 RepID=A0A8K0A3M5_BRALA|nr:Hypp3748 [Branchiostoma lanceolatum]